jgi:alkaline phosphatase
MIKLIPRTSASLIAVVLFSVISCKKVSSDILPVAKDSTVVKSTAITKAAITPALKTRNVIVIVVDGARYSETWEIAPINTFLIYMPYVLKEL